MTTPDSFASADDAAAYGFTLADAAAAGLLARATQALRDAAGIPITQTTSTLELDAERGCLKIPTPLVSSVTTVAEINDDDTTTDITDWRWLRKRNAIRLGDSLSWRQRHEARYAVTYVHGFATLPPALVMLTAAVAYRLSATPVGALAGLKSKTVGSVSWTAGDTPGAKLTDAEECSLGRIVPVPVMWQVPL